uniref:Uncharacterized protein n=1 Tax=Brassica oleracea var. oleracea TaxID=109376 RepID=A0A0D3BUN2_BRAOL
MTEDEKGKKKVLIDFGLNLINGCLRIPFEDQAERSSIERVEQEIELPGRVRLGGELRGRDKNSTIVPARPSAKQDWSCSADGRAGRVFGLARPEIIPKDGINVVRPARRMVELVASPLSSCTRLNVANMSRGSVLIDVKLKNRSMSGVRYRATEGECLRLTVLSECRSTGLVPGVRGFLCRIFVSTTKRWTRLVFV